LESRKNLAEIWEITKKCAKKRERRYQKKKKAKKKIKAGKNQIGRLRR